MLKIIFTLFIFIFVESASARQCIFVFSTSSIVTSIRDNLDAKTRDASNLIDALMGHFDNASETSLPTDAQIHELIVSKVLTPDHILPLIPDQTLPLTFDTWMLLEKAARIDPNSPYSVYNSMVWKVNNSEQGNITARTRIVQSLLNHFEIKELDKYLSLKMLKEMIDSEQIKLHRVKKFAFKSRNILYKIFEENGLYNVAVTRGLAEVIEEYEYDKPGLKPRLRNALQSYFVEYKLNPNPTIPELQSWINGNKERFKSIPAIGKELTSLLDEIIESEQLSEN